VQTFSADGVVQCPTCHTPTSNIQKTVKSAEQRIPDLELRLKKEKENLDAIVFHRSACLDWDKRNAQRDTEEKQIQESLSVFSNVEVPALSEEESAKIVADYANFQKAEADILLLSQAAKEKRAALDGAIKATQQRQEELKSNLSDIKVTKAEAALAATVLNTLSQQCVTRQTLEKQHAEIKFTCDNINQQYLAAIENEEKAEKLRDWNDVANRAKDALKAAPRIVAARNLKRLESAINELLQIFSVDFFIRAADGESPTFIAEFFDGRKQPAKRLSYGQKTVLALAFRVAVNALFAEEIGLLALDEPTAYLDQQRIKALAPVLEKLRELSTARGLQCLLVTHETSLAHLFESAVELDVQ
jgi:exonuclease SbcC